MPGSSNSTDNAPRVFISYARADGEQFATQLRKSLQAEAIPLWQDRIGMEGGRDWWLQITAALDHVEFMVLVMTPAAMQSPNVRKEWRYARQQGVCVYPIKASPNLDFASLPRWMRDVHWYDLDHEWPKFVNDLNTRCQQVRVPFIPYDKPADFVERSKEFEELISKLLDEKREEPIAITAALRGAGGYGKTTIAIALCHDERIQEAFDDGMLWVTLGEQPGNLVGKLEDLIYILSHERPGFTGIDAATAYFAELLADRDILLVIDDAWNAAQIKAFLQGGKRCARLITTRDDSVLPPDAQRIWVDAMRPNEAVQLLSAGLDGSGRSTSENEALRKLAERLGEWALLLTLVNGALREHVNKYHRSLPDALAYSNTALEKHGLTAFDAKNAQDRSQAVTKTLHASFELLQADEYARYKELAVFPEDVDIPLATLHKLWGTTGQLDDFDTEALCIRLHELSLLSHFDPTARTIRLHDVVRTYLQTELGAKERTTLHRHLLDAYPLDTWADLPRDEPYLWDHLAEHLVGAERVEELIATAKDLRYLATKTLLRKAAATEIDLTAAEQQAPTDVQVRLLKRNFIQMSHLLNRCETFRDLAPVLHSRLCHLHELSHLCQAWEPELPRLYLIPWHPLPDLPHPALIRTLSGHTNWVRGCAISAQGDYIVSASADDTLKVWDARSGAERLTLRGHTDTVRSCAISPQGDLIVSASEDKTLKVWDAHSGAERLTLRGHTAAVNGCAVSQEGDFIVSASEDKTLKVWDARSGAERLTLRGHTDWVHGCAVSAQGDWIVSASGDKTLKLWDARSGAERLTLRGHTDRVRSCAVSQEGDCIVSASEDKTLKVWDARSGAERLTLRGHSSGVYGCAVSQEGDCIVSASHDKTLKVWDARSGAERLTLRGHTDWVHGCAVSQEGDCIVSASHDKTLKVWDARSGAERLTLRGHTAAVNGCAVSQEGDCIVSASYDNTLKVWDAHSGAERLTLRGHTVAVNGCAVSQEGDCIVSASGDKTLKLWDARSGAERLTLRGHTVAVNGCAVSQEGDCIVSASHDKTLKVWDARSGAERLTLRGHSSGVYGCAVSQEGDCIVSASHDKTLKVWDARSGAERLTLRGHTDWVHGCAVSQEGDCIVSASHDFSLKLWDVRTGDCLCTLFVDGPLYRCAFHPDGEHLVAAGAGGVYFLRWVR